MGRKAIKAIEQYLFLKPQIALGNDKSRCDKASFDALAEILHLILSAVFSAADAPSPKGSAKAFEWYMRKANTSSTAPHQGRKR
jgi:hypothetical protein